MSRLRGRRWRCLGASVTVMACLPLSTLAVGPAALRHPLHTTLTDVVLDPADGAMRLTIRAFADDLRAAAARHGGTVQPADHPAPDALIAAYVAGAVSVTDSTGRHAAMTWDGTRQTGNLLWMTVRVPSVRTLRGVKLGCALLFEIFDDQVNLVQATDRGRRQTTLFTSGDGRKLKGLF
jgi:uncharacterized protein DUF6702